MQHYEDRSSMQAPGVCFVCEHTPTDGVGYVDTLLNFDPGFGSSLAGRKYVCDSCVKNLANQLGYYSVEDVDAAKLAESLAVARYNGVREHVALAVALLTDTALVDAGDKTPAVVVADVSGSKPARKKSA